MADLETYVGYAAQVWGTYKTLGGLKRTAEVTGAVVLGAAALGVGVGIVRAVVQARRGIDLNGKVVLIAGGSRGLGLILARLVAAEGAKVALCARNPDDLETARQDLIARGTPATSIFIHPCDVTDAAQVSATVQATRAALGPIDVLINNAGMIQVGPADTQTEGDYDESFKTHFWGPYHFVQGVLPDMKARQSGRIVNISSIGGLVSVPHLLPYSTSKFALVGFSQGLRSELMQEGIYVTTVCPGLIRTGSAPNAFFKGQHRKEYTWFTLSDSLPGASQSADAAARQIVHALKAGEAMVVTSVLAQTAALVHGIFPGVVTDAMGLANRLLPGADGPESVGTARRTGSESKTPITEGPLTALTQKAERDNNQRPHPERSGQMVSDPAVAG